MRRHSGFKNFNANFKYLTNLGDKNKLQIVANVLDSPDAMDSGGLNANELESDRRQARARNIEFDARESVKQYKLGINLKSTFNNFGLTNSIYYNKRLFDGKLPFRNGGIIELDKSFWGYKLNFEFDCFRNILSKTALSAVFANWKARPILQVVSSCHNSYQD